MTLSGAARIVAPFSLALLTALAPVMMILVWLASYQHSSLYDHVPITSDSMDYWLEVAAFIKSGFGNGYFGYEELHATIGGYGAHSVWYPMFMAFFGWAFGLHLYSIPLWQMVLQCLCILGFFALARPTTRQGAFLLAFTATYPPLLFWQAFSMQETLHFALGILLAGFSWQMLVRYAQGRLTPGFRAAYVAAVVFATLMRFTWVLFLLPYFAVMARPTAKGMLLAVLKFACVYVVMHMVAFHLFRVVFPYGNTRGFIIGQALRGDFGPLTELLDFNIYSLFRELRHDPQSYTFVMRYQILAFIPTVTAGCWLGRSGLARVTGLSPAAGASFALLHALTLGGIVAMMLLLYSAEDIVFFKLATPVFVFAVYLAARSLPLKWMWLLVVVNVLSLPAAMGYLQNSMELSFDRHGKVLARAQTFRQQTQGTLRFTPGASPWCNTLVISEFPSELLAVPPGIGINYVESFAKFEGRLKSRYVLFPRSWDPGLLARVADVQLLARTEVGDLYLNSLAACPAAPTDQSVAP